MKTSEHHVDDLVRSELGSSSMSEAEAAATWTMIEAALTQQTSSSGLKANPKSSRRRFAIGLTVGVATLFLAIVALLPVWSDSDKDGPGIGSLASASASEVLAVTSEESSLESLFPAEGERLYFRSTQVSSDASAVQRIEEWIGPDGLGYRRDPTRGGSSQGSTDGPTDFEPLSETFDASTGPDPRFGVSESWRAVLSIGQAVDLSADPATALRQLRRSVLKAVGRSPDLPIYVQNFVGSDLIVLMTVTNLLTQAPLTGEQREGLFKLIETSPTWMRSDGTAPASTKNLGESISRAGQAGVLVETSIELSRMSSAILGVNQGIWRFGVLLDPRAGTVLEVRKTQAGEESPYSVTTTDKLEIVGDGRDQ